LAFATAFASSGSQPCQNRCREKGLRNFELIKKLLQDGQSSGELKQEFDLDELAMGIYGQLNTYVMVSLFFPGRVLDRHTAGRIVELFMKGARRGKSRGKIGKQSSILN